MPISAIDQVNLVREFAVWAIESEAMKGIMLPVGVAGEAAKQAEVIVVMGAVIDGLWGQAAPTILP